MIFVYKGQSCNGKEDFKMFWQNKMLIIELITQKAKLDSKIVIYLSTLFPFTYPNFTLIPKFTLLENFLLQKHTDNPIHVVSTSITCCP